LIKFIYSEKATKFCEISTNCWSYVLPVGGDFAKFCGLLRIHELYYLETGFDEQPDCKNYHKMCALNPQSTTVIQNELPDLTFVGGRPNR
jgi:hypothetical protein